MIECIESHRTELAALCRRYRVNTLVVFGSAADGTYEPARSDLDFLVNFLPIDKGEIAPDYFGLLHALEDLFRCRIDLVMEKAIRNPYFRRGINQGRQLVYAA
jgi:predicted nucleotidyltransferase